MSAVGVVVPNVIDDRLAGLCARVEVLAVHAFDLERAVERFHRRVVPAVPLAAHRHRDATRLQNLAVVTSGVLGEFNRSSEHFDIRGCDESSKAAIGSGRTCEDEVTRATARLTSFGETPALAGNWRRMLKRRSGSESRNFPGGRDTVVSGVWGNATIASLFVRATAFGSLLVVRRA